jgi:5-methylcytosine-specific restriction endonuclease McrA
MILKQCDTCQIRTAHNRRQWAEEDERVTIRTEYTCTECGTVYTIDNEFLPNE